MERMFCPKCRREMVERDGEFWCLSGNMAFSRRLLDMLREALRAPTLPRNGGQPAGTWFCPRCANGMVPCEPRKLPHYCPRCGLHLHSGIIYTLVEHHPHGAIPPEGAA